MSDLNRQYLLKGVTFYLASVAKPVLVALVIGFGLGWWLT